MKTRKSKFRKSVDLMLPPGEMGPLCPYPKTCTPTTTTRKSTLDLSLWRKTPFSMGPGTEYLNPSPDEEMQFINAWILQLLRRELGMYLEAAEAENKGPLEIKIDALAAGVIARALAIRTPRPKPGEQSP